MVSKTREKLIEVARQLFVHKGLDNTTMNDIANASDKGRRTIYTYFKSKREIYNAVIERESDLRVSRLRGLAEDDSLQPVEKLKKFLTDRYQLSSISPSRTSSDSIRSMFSLDFKRVDRIRQLSYEKESALFKSILDEGVASGAFNQEQSSRLNHFMHRWLLLADWSSSAQFVQPEEAMAYWTDLIDFIVYGIQPHNQ